MPLPETIRTISLSMKYVIPNLNDSSFVGCCPDMGIASENLLSPDANLTDPAHNFYDDGLNRLISLIGKRNGVYFHIYIAFLLTLFSSCLATSRHRALLINGGCPLQANHATGSRPRHPIYDGLISIAALLLTVSSGDFTGPVTAYPIAGSIPLKFITVIKHPGSGSDRSTHGYSCSYARRMVGRPITRYLLITRRRVIDPDRF